MNKQNPDTPSQVVPDTNFFRQLWNRIKAEWLSFLIEVFKPIPMVLLIFTVILGIVQANLTISSGADSDNGNVASVSALTILVISIASSIYGAIVYDRWKQVQEQNKLALKGQSALRGLQMLLVGTRNQKKKIQQYRDTFVKFDEVNIKDVEMLLRELEQSSTYLTTYVLSSLGEWGDILPNSVYTIREKVDAFAEIEQEITDTKAALKSKEIELTNVQNASELDKQTKVDLEAEVKDLRSKVADLEHQERAAARLFTNAVLRPKSASEIVKDVLFNVYTNDARAHGMSVIRSSARPVSPGAPTQEVDTTNNQSFDN